MAGSDFTTQTGDLDLGAREEVGNTGADGASSGRRSLVGVVGLRRSSQLYGLDARAAVRAAQGSTLGLAQLICGLSSCILVSAGKCRSRGGPGVLPRGLRAPRWGSRRVWSASATKGMPSSRVPRHPEVSRSVFRDNICTVVQSIEISAAPKTKPVEALSTRTKSTAALAWCPALGY